MKGTMQLLKNIIRKFNPTITVSGAGVTVTNLVLKFDNGIIEINLQVTGTGITVDESFDDCLKIAKNEIDLAIKNVMNDKFKINCNCELEEREPEYLSGMIYLFWAQCYSTPPQSTSLNNWPRSTDNLFTVKIGKITSNCYYDGIKKTKAELLSELEWFKFYFCIDR